MDLYLYSAFLVLMTTQSTLQYSFTFTQSHTFILLLAAICCSMRHSSGFSILLKDTSACRDFLGRLGIELLTFRLEDDHSTPSATANDANLIHVANLIRSSLASIREILGLFLKGLLRADISTCLTRLGVSGKTKLIRNIKSWTNKKQ